jgi:hypothetical protein
MCQHLSDTGVSTGVGTVSTGVGIDMSDIRTCPSGFKRWISGYPDIRISGYPDIRISGHVRISTRTWTYMDTGHACWDQTQHKHAGGWTIPPAHPAHYSALCLSSMRLSEASTSILPVLGGVCLLEVVQDGEIGVFQRAHYVLEQHPSAQ